MSLRNLYIPVYCCLAILFSTKLLAQDITISGNAKINLSGTIKFRLSDENSALNLEDNAGLEDETNTFLILEGDLNSNTDLFTLSGSLVFDGAAPQNLNASIALRTLTVSNSHALSVGGSVLITNQLQFDQSIITTDQDNALTITEGANISGAGSNGYVDGPLRVRANGTTANILNFPIGKGNAYYPLRLRLDQSSSTGLYVAEVYTSDIPTNALDASLQSVSNSKYWSVRSNERVTNPYIELPVDGSDGVASTALARVAKAENGTWANLGGINLSSVPGTIRSSVAFTDFGNFIIASAAPNNNPSISSITPDAGEVGDLVTITGTNLGTSPGTIKFGNITVNSTDITSWTDTEIQVRVPQGLNPGENVGLEITVNGANEAINFDFIFEVQAEGNCNDFSIVSFPKNDNRIVVGENTALIAEVNDASSVSTAQIYYKGIAEDNWEGPFNVSNNGNEYTYQVNANVDDIGIEYYFEFTFNGCANVISNTAYAYLYYPNGVVIPDLTAGNTAGDYNLFSIPLELDNAGPTSVLDELGQYDKSRWRLFRVQNSNYQELGNFNIEPGRGYLLIFDEPTSFDSGAGSVVRANSENPFQMSLRQGWNMIATPYPFPIQWEDVLEDNGIGALGDFYYYTSSGYNRGNGILPLFQGAIWFAENATNISVSPIKDNSISGGRIAANNRLKEQFDTDNWELDLLLQDNQGSKITGGIGMREDASLSKDEFDGMRPPKANFHSSFHFEHDDYFYPYFLKDVVPNSSEHEWEFEVIPSLESSTLTLEWDHILIKELGLPLYLEDESTGFTVDMAQNNIYAFTAKEKARFKILYGDSQLNSKIFIGEVFPNPTSEQVNIPFSLPVDAVRNNAVFTIFDMTGKKILSQTLENVKGGFHEHQLMFTNNDLSKGLYLLNLHLESDDLTKSENMRFLVK